MDGDEAIQTTLLRMYEDAVIKLSVKKSGKKCDVKVRETGDDLLAPQSSNDVISPLWNCVA
jgi:hypothetical protein